MTREPMIERITVEGSTPLVAEYILFGINHILFLRGVVDPNEIVQIARYKLRPLFVVKDKRGNDPFDRRSSELKRFFMEKMVQEVLLVISNKESNEVYEEWHFNVNYDSIRNFASASKAHGSMMDEARSLKMIQREIRALIRRILESTNPLLLLDQEDLTFDIRAVLNFRFGRKNGWAVSRTINIL